jgi:hypothetical protein
MFGMTSPESRIEYAKWLFRTGVIDAALSELALLESEDALTADVVLLRYDLNTLRRARAGQHYSRCAIPKTLKRSEKRSPRRGSSRSEKNYESELPYHSKSSRRPRKKR